MLITCVHTNGLRFDAFGFRSVLNNAEIGSQSSRQWPKKLMNGGIETGAIELSHFGSPVKIKGALVTGYGGRSNLEVAYGTGDWLFGTLEISSGYLRITSWLSPIYEIRKEFIEKLIFRQPRALKGLGIAWLRILHKMAGAPEYIAFATCNPTELKGTLTSAGYNLERVPVRESPAQ